jgi:flagellar biosynthesis protein FlhG
MTRIVTITSGLPGTGKTHLSINIALEQVRRGYQAGVFHARECASPVEDLLRVQQPVSVLRRASDDKTRGLMRSAYQGIDIVSCATPLRDWPLIETEQRMQCIREMDIQHGYDDFLIDTSGMDVRTLLACCRASGMVVLVVTPKPQSRAEAFALIRILLLNGFSGELMLLVNKIVYPVDVKDIHFEFNRLVKACLGQGVPLLGVIPLDENVSRAQQVRQAFSAVFPESKASVGLIALVDTLNKAMVQSASGAGNLMELWHTLIEVIQQPVVLPGDSVLEDGIEMKPEPARLPAV